MNKTTRILTNVGVGCVLAAFSMSCDTRGTGLGAATGAKHEQTNDRTMAQRSGTAAAIVGRPDDQRVYYTLTETDYVADHDGIRLILAEEILFGEGEATIKENARDKLEDINDLLNYYGNDPIKISGHADDKGDPALNQQLSTQRAEAVKQYLVSTHNIDPNRIEAVGYGNEFPVTGQDSRQDPQYAGKNRENRRVEIKVTTSKPTPSAPDAARPAGG